MVVHNKLETEIQKMFPASQKSIEQAWKDKQQRTKRRQGGCDWKVETSGELRTAESRIIKQEVKPKTRQETPAIKVKLTVNKKQGTWGERNNRSTYMR